MVSVHLGWHTFEIPEVIPLEADINPQEST